MRRSNALFYGTVQATEEAILNAMLAATTMTGADGLRIHALPHDRLLAALRKYGRLRVTAGESEDLAVAIPYVNQDLTPFQHLLDRATERRVDYALRLGDDLVEVRRGS